MFPRHKDGNDILRCPLWVVRYTLWGHETKPNCTPSSQALSASSTTQGVTQPHGKNSHLKWGQDGRP